MKRESEAELNIVADENEREGSRGASPEGPRPGSHISAVHRLHASESKTRTRRANLTISLVTNKKINDQYILLEIT